MIFQKDSEAIQLKTHSRKHNPKPNLKEQTGIVQATLLHT